MVPLLLLMKAGNGAEVLAPLRHCLQASLIVLGIALAGQTAQALTNALTITTTTYLDSRVSNQTLNYGHAHTVKALINNNVTSDGSICRGLFQLPPQIWTYPPEQILSATVVFYVWQDNTRKPKCHALSPHEEFRAGNRQRNLARRRRDLADL